MRSLRVLILTGSLRFGGAERQSVALANGLAAAGLEVNFGYFAPEHQLRELLAPAVRERTFCLEKGSRLDLGILLRLRGRLASISPDIVICANPYPLFLACIARMGLLRRRPRLLVVLHATRLDDGIETFMVRRILARVINRPSVTAIFLSHAQLEHWRSQYGIRAASARVIYNGVDPQHYAPLPDPRAADGGVVLAICAGLRPEKRHLDFPAAVGELVANGDDVRGLLIGDGPERGRIEAWCREHGLEARCELTGFRVDVRPDVARADACVLSSSTETFPMSLLEAMSMGRPVVAPRLGGIPEQVEDNVSGILFEPGRPGALTEALRRFLALGPARARAMGEAGRARVIAHFSEEKMVAAYLSVLQAIGLLL